MRKIITFFTFIIFLNISFAQNTDLDQLYFKYIFVQLPAKPIKDPALRTYSVTQNIYHQYKNSGAKILLFDDTKIEGFEKKENGGFLNVTISLEAPTVLSKENVVRAAKSKNKDGIEVTTNYYTPTWTYRQNGNCVVKDSLNNILATYSLRAERVFKVSEMGNKASAESTLSNVFENRIDVGMESVKNAQTTVNQLLNKDFGYPLFTGTDYLWITGSSKHPDYDAQKKAHQTISVNFATMQGGSDMDEMKKNVQSAIDYFERVDKTYNTDDKKHKKMRYGAYYNLAVIYQYLDMPDKQIEWANKVISNEFDEKDGEKLITKAKEIKNILAVNGAQNRHMLVKTVVPVKVETVEVKKPYSLEEDKRYTTGRLIKQSGDTIVAYIRMVHPNQMKGSLTTQVKGLNGKYIEKIVYATDISEVLYDNGDVYKGLYFAPPTTPGTINLDKSEAFFVKEIYKGKKMSVYQFLSTDVVIHRAGSKTAESMGSAGWSLSPRKKFLDLAKDCPELTKRAEAKEFNTQVNSLVEFAKALELCK